ncbi:unnamed protein product [Schistosoma intercalatum]|nr:unnamed protein product [Schistosoma intercalatum]
MFALKKDSTLEEILNNSSDYLNVNKLLDYADTTSSCKLTHSTNKETFRYGISALNTATQGRGGRFDLTVHFWLQGRILWSLAEYLIT